MIDLQKMKTETLKDRGITETVYFEPGQYVVKTKQVLINTSPKGTYLIIKSKIIDAKSGSINSVGSDVSYARKINSTSIIDIDNIANAINEKHMDLNALSETPALFEDRFVKVSADKITTDKGSFTKITFHKVSQEEPKQWTFREVEVEIPVSKLNYSGGVAWATAENVKPF